MNDDALLDALTLHLVPGIGPRATELLLAAFSSPAAVLTAGEEQLRRVPGVGPKLARSVTQASREDALAEWERCQQRNATVTCRGREDYPRLLLETPDPPAVLYRQGTLTPADEIAVAIVGARHCTYYGISQAQRLAGSLARAGITIVSGLARGIDAAAHRAALAAGGRTIAVTATGLESVYPPEHVGLAEEIIAAGAILTEFRLDQTPLAGLFPQRNRIISGISLGVIVVEASRRSGALHTARHALEQNRDVFAVPGRVDSAASEGCHNLIRDGAVLVRGVDDVLSHLGPLVRQLPPSPSQHNSPPRETTPDRAPRPNADGATPARKPAELSLSNEEQSLLAQIGTDPLSIDQLLAAVDLAAPRVLSGLTILEMKRLVRRLPGNTVVRTS